MMKAAGAQVATSMLDSELQQLGLPKEHAAALVKVYTDNQIAMYDKLSQAKGINSCGGDNTFQADVKGLQVAGQIEPIVQLTINTDNQSRTQPAKVCMTSDQLNILIYELDKAKQIMTSLS